MASNDLYQAPFDIDSETMEPDLVAAQAAWVDAEFAEPDAADTVLSSPFVGQWHALVSRTNWEKGQIISRWRQAQIESGSPSSHYSDESWARQVGGVTAPHVGRLRRVFAQFGDTCESYPHLSWTHFLAAIDWDDSPLWLQGASDGRWSVSLMRKQRWKALGGAPEDRPQDVDVITSELDEDFVNMSNAGQDSPTMTQPAQGGGSGKKFEEQPNGISSGRIGEGPDFGDEDSLNRFASESPNAAIETADEAPSEGVLVQPFAGLPPLPDDLADAVELLKLAIVRHKATGWQSVELDTIRAYLSAFLILIDARSR